MRQQKITLGEMRESGTRELLAYCADYRCSNLRRLAPERVDGWPDDVRISDIERRFVCTKCGLRGAEVRPDFKPLEVPPAVARGFTQR
jgi:hypothetical protein